MQLYLYDNVFIKDGVKDEQTGTDFSGMSGRLVSIGYRNETFPFTAEITIEDKTEEYRFTETELVLKPEGL